MSSRPRGRKFSGRQKAKHRARNIRANNHTGAGRYRQKRSPSGGMKEARTASFLLAAALLVGCSSGPQKEEVHSSGTDAASDAARRIAAVREEAISSPSGELDKLEEIRVPVEELWLAQPLQVRFRDMRADHAIRALVQDRPVRFEMDLTVENEIPRVRRSRSARTIREHLDSIAVQADWAWSMQSGVVRVRDIETRRFALASQPGKYAAGLGLRNLNESGGSVADNNMELSLDPYAEEILEHVRNVLGLDAGGGGEGEPAPPVPEAASEVLAGIAAPLAGGFRSGEVDPRTAVSISPSSNRLTVTARPNAMREVETLIEDFNSAVSLIVRISLSVVEIDFRDRKNRNLAADLIRQSTEFPIGLLLGNATGAIVPDGGAAIRGAYVEEGAREAGSTAVVQWLDTLGDAVLTYHDTVEVMNNRISSVDLTRTEGYVSRIAREAVEGSNRLRTTVEFDDLRTGLVVHLQPTVSSRADGRITLTLGFSRSSLVGRTPFNFGDIEGETFITDDLNRYLSISLRDGETRLLASLSEAETRGERSRIPIFGRFGIGTSNESSVREREMIMAITATVIDG